MTKATSSPILQAIFSMVEDQRVKELGDRELLCRFVAERDEAAFHTLMRRHGPMVLNVCRNMLANQADAEDAFQATFLVFARKAKSIREATSLGSWLYGVAYRIALKAQAEFTKRKKHESLVPKNELLESADDLAWRDVTVVIHRELNALPERYRATLVLCYLEGQTQDEAAQQLNLPKGTLKGRLERGRALLRKRLVRRGLGSAAVLVASAWSPAVAEELPTALMDSTARIAASLAAGRAVTGLIPAKVVNLTEGVVHAMFITRLKIATVFLLILSVFGAGAGALIHAKLAADQKECTGPSEQTTGGPSQHPPLAHAAAIAENPKDERADPKQPALPVQADKPPHIVEKPDMKGRLESSWLPYKVFGGEPTEDGLLVASKAFCAKMGTYPDIRFREFFDPRYLKKHGLTDRDIAFEFADHGGIHNIIVADDLRTVLCIVESKGRKKEERELIIMRCVVYDGHLYISPEKAPDPKTGIFKPWILRTKVN